MDIPVITPSQDFSKTLGFGEPKGVYPYTLNSISELEMGYKIFEKKLKEFIESYKKDSNTYRVLIDKYPNLINVFDICFKEEFKEALEINKNIWKEVVSDQSLEIKNLKRKIYDEEADKLIQAIRNKISNS